ncbi:acyltransferase domain-containing protein [Rhodobium gokarnense]|uniref:Acyl transferase domain-containing protein n=1 Tax=Rhodobium gokarnense TaxID=364296 RepID=A0ABT3H837_9HYPH|nr:acyltransferase domain-containing protein [Rhodobium gokarnense]MCW2306562.1 acyl transferase domain-containing protein [Rhodobium gokarnense]
MSSVSPSLPTVFCFAGQGSQYYHMAGDVMGEHAVFRQWMEIGDEIVRNAEGFSPLEAIYGAGRKASEPFDRLEHSHPSLFLVQFALAKLLQAKGIKPDMLLGVSLGEFVAMSVAGMFPFETALRAVARQPKVFAETAPKGALIAVLAPETIREASPVLAEATELAGTNAAAHCVLACPASETGRVLDELRRLDVAFQQLPVPFAFHSRWVDSAKDAYLAAVADLSFETPFWPVWSACLAAPVERMDGALTWRIVRDGMRLRDTFSAIEARGGARYLDLSPSGSLAAVLRQDLRDGGSEIVPLVSPFGGNLKRLSALFGVGRA